MPSEYAAVLEKIEAALDEWLPEAPAAAWRARVFTGTGEGGDEAALRALTVPCRDLVKRGGKRWRPLLMALVGSALGGDKGLDRAVQLSPLVEFPHNASLIHDDIEDDSRERRGRPAVHLLYGADLALNSGSFLYFLPLACLAQVPGSPEWRALLYAAWASHLRSLHLGQAADISWHRDFNSMPSSEAYERMCRLKTGCLARLGAVLGVLAGHPAPESREAEALAGRLGSAAETLGLGFQILDDVKNLREGVPGKQRGDDVAEGKKSLPVILFLQGARDRAAQVIRCFTAARAAGVSAPEVNELIAAMEGAGAVEEAARRGKALVANACAALAECDARLAGLAALLG
ncbi:MAG: polyprenyl synthetase family protein [Treponema sp.]|jgi:octaprenyl-diphosphate synthase|nr:polyprenyl synthetase family protein [Treponema sp.]